MADVLRATYDLTCDATEVEGFSKDIAYEQTVEVPESLVPPEIRDRVVGKIQSITPISESPAAFRTVIDYPASHIGGQWPQLLNLIYGNISLKKNIRLTGLEFPDSFLSTIYGPNYGIDGIRKRLGVYGRPLLSTALKPYGSKPEVFAEMAKKFALGGGDLIKDDHNLHEDSFDDFTRRALMCRDAVLEAEKTTGRPTLYFPNVMAPVEELERALAFLHREGFFGILISPFAVGLDMFRYLVEKYPICYMAHPSFTGAHFFDDRHGIAHGVFLGTMFRMLGADVSIFPNYGGRFSFTRQDCHDICDRLREPLGDLASAFPAPAGGMKFDNIPTMSADFGVETVYLIGGALIGYSSDLTESTQAFMAKVREHFNERLEDPDEGFVSACELPSAKAAGVVVNHLPFNEFRWEGRESEAYKDSSSDLPFKNVSRCELIGKHGENTAYDLRYFEIGPGGFSSLEKHNHTHTVICVRGEGVLMLGDERIELKHLDTAYVKPMQVHQLRNESDEPFGFFCIVDHERDQPVKP
ncbi:MAG: cupin domain-containing protein [bacterium]|nr:cupin domain-containing protein [bacterium]